MDKAMTEKFKGKMFRFVRHVQDNEMVDALDYMLYHGSEKMAIEYLAQWDDGDSSEPYVNYEKMVESCGNGQYHWQNDYVLFRQTGGLGYSLFAIINMGFYDITYQEIAEILIRNPDKALDFTLETAQEAYESNGEPTAWYGVKIVTAFDCLHGTLIFGYYGGDNHTSISIGEYLEHEGWERQDVYMTPEEELNDHVIRIGKMFQKHLSYVEGHDEPTVCTYWGIDKVSKTTPDSKEGGW